MKLIFKPLLSLLVFILCTCTDDDRSIPVSERYLKDVTIAGAQNVTLNNDQDFIQITLPETYTKDSIELDLKFGEGSGLSQNRLVAGTSGNKIWLLYKGQPSGGLQIWRKQDSSYKTYRIYVEHLGPLRAELAADTICILGKLEGSDLGNFIVLNNSIKIISGMGTSPSRPDLNEAFVTMRDSLDTILSTGRFNPRILYMSADTSIISGRKVSIQLTSDDKVFSFPGSKMISNNPNNCGLPW